MVTQVNNSEQLIHIWVLLRLRFNCVSFIGKSILIVDCRFVRFLELNECQSAIRHMNGKTVKGSKIIVEPASSLKQRIKGRYAVRDRPYFSAFSQAYETYAGGRG